MEKVRVNSNMVTPKKERGWRLNEGDVDLQGRGPRGKSEQEVVTDIWIVMGGEIWVLSGARLKARELKTYSLVRNAKG